MLDISPNFTVDDIRKVRNDFADRHADMDWNAINKEIEDSAVEMRALMERRKRERTA
ncbi:hypothetical protein FACS18949_10530 [Clostridia bacterium]|nr:hypothetical protein FACS18949_10530 [Clostridia bacterium]